MSCGRQRDLMSSTRVAGGCLVDQVVPGFVQLANLSQTALRDSTYNTEYVTQTQISFKNWKQLKKCMWF